MVYSKLKETDKTVVSHTAKFKISILGKIWKEMYSSAATSMLKEFCQKYLILYFYISQYIYS